MHVHYHGGPRQGRAELARKQRAHKPRDADPNAERHAYSVGVNVTVPERRELEKRAEAERRSVSSWLTRIVLGKLSARG